MKSRREFLAAASGAAMAAGTELLIAGSVAAQPAAPPSGGNANGAARPAGGGGPGLSNEHTEFVLSPSADPYQLFAQWYQEAKDAGEGNVNAMTLATVDASGLPNARMMLHQEVMAGDFLFTSFANSAKGKEMRRNSKVALVFYWNKLGRQIRVRGSARQMTKAEADERWNARRSARDLRLRDLAWPQSEEFATAEELEQRLIEMAKRYPNEVPRRDWTGWLVNPLSIEFFYPHSKTLLHERLRFSRRNAKAGWVAQRIIP